MTKILKNPDVDFNYKIPSFDTNNKIPILITNYKTPYLNTFNKILAIKLIIKSILKLKKTIWHWLSVILKLIKTYNFDTDYKKIPDLIPDAKHLTLTLMINLWPWHWLSNTLIYYKLPPFDTDYKIPDFHTNLLNYQVSEFDTDNCA